MKKNSRQRRSIESLFSALARSYGPIGELSAEEPIDVLVRTILSQNTSDSNSDAAFGLLRRRFSDWNDVMNADPKELAAVIRCGGLANIKARRIKQTLQTIRAREGKLSLACLKKLDNVEAMTYLTSLPGVGAKTACCALLFAFGRPLMPVDTHVSRIVRRLGWVETRAPTERIHERLEAMIPDRLILPMHLYIIRHGRKVCRPTNPACRICQIKPWCAFFKKRGPDAS